MFPPQLVCALAALLVVATACVGSGPPLASPPGGPANATLSAPPPLPTATEAPAPAPAAEPCPPAQQPAFGGGFAALKARLGERMGEPLTCERAGPDGTALQQTTRGFARYDPRTNTPSFASGAEHWALGGHGLIHWVGRDLDPPPDADLLDATAAAPAPTAPEVVAAPAAAPVGTGTAFGEALGLLREYDRRYGTVLVPAIGRASISSAAMPGVRGMWVPSRRRIVLGLDVLRESPQVIAAVLAHEGQHAVDTFTYGGPRTTAACYAWEISAFSLEANVWASFYGTGGKPAPLTELEAEQNEIARQARSDAGHLVSRLMDAYRDECE